MPVKGINAYGLIATLKMIQVLFLLIQTGYILPQPSLGTAS